MRSAASSSERMVLLVRSVSATAERAISRPRAVCWPISRIEFDSSSVAATVRSTLWRFRPRPTTPNAMRRSVSSATFCMVAEVVGQRAGRFLDRADHLADRAVELGDRLVDGLPPGRGRLLDPLQLERRGGGEIEEDRLRQHADPFGQRRRRKAMPARQRIDRGPQHRGAAVDAGAAFEAERGFLLDGARGSPPDSAASKFAVSSSRNCAISIRRKSLACLA